MKQDSTSQTDTTNYTLICNLGRKIFNQWEGKIIEDGKKIVIVSNNLLGEKKVECKVAIGLLNCEKFPYSVDGDEKTCSIIGGCGCPCEDLEEVEKRAVQTLIRYKFEQKKEISLFDFEW